MVLLGVTPYRLEALIYGNNRKPDKFADIIISILLMTGMLISQYFEQYQSATSFGAICDSSKKERRSRIHPAYAF